MSETEQFGHPEVPGGWLCEKWDESIQPDEVENAGGDCPWCGRAVEGTTTRGCPFTDCEWAYEYDPDDYSESVEADYRSETHYEEEHAGRIEIQVTLEREQMIGDRDPKEIREHYIDDAQFGGWAIAHTRTKVIEEADDHDLMQRGDGRV